MENGISETQFFWLFRLKYIAVLTIITTGWIRDFLRRNAEEMCKHRERQSKKGQDKIFFKIGGGNKIIYKCSDKLNK